MPQMNLDKAYKNFFRDKSIGFTKFKSKKNPVQSYTTIEFIVYEVV